MHGQIICPEISYVRGTKKNNTWFVRQEIDVQDMLKQTKKPFHYWKKV